MTNSFFTMAGLPELPVSLLRVLETLAIDSFALRELWWYAVVLDMMDEEVAFSQGKHTVEGRDWIQIHTVVGDDFMIPDPGLNQTQEADLLNALRNAFSIWQDTLDADNSPWQDKVFASK